MASGIAAIGGGSSNNPNAPRVPNLNERLNRALDRIETEADRIERCLSRINGTPPKGEHGKAEISATRNLVAVVEGMENQAERLRSLAENVDQVA